MLYEAAKRAAAALDEMAAKAKGSSHGSSGSGSGSGSGSPAKRRRRPKTVLGRLWAGVKGRVASSRMGKGFKSGHGAGKSIGGIAGRTGGAVGGAVGGTVGAVVAVGMALYKLERQLAAVSEAALAAQEKYKEVSAGQANTFAEKEVRDLVRNVRHGDATADSTRELMQADAKRKDATDRLAIVFENAQNKFLTVLNEAVAPPLEILADVVIRIANAWPFNLGIARPGGDVGLAGVLPDLLAEARRLEAAGQNLLGIARAAAARGRAGFAAPANPAPPGRGPI